MIRPSFFTILLACLVPGAATGEETGWEDWLAHRFSRKLASVEKELAAIQAELPKLPAVPVADQGGTGGFASLHTQAEPPKDGEYAVTLRFPSAGTVDLVALVPARRYGVGGLEAQFGLPDSFAVDLLDGDGKPVARVAEEQALWADPVRAGHPFVYRLTPAVEAAALRISARRLRLDPGITQSFVHAWAEAFVFEGERDLARGSEVKPTGGSPPTAPWNWANAYLVDGQTPLGLPEILAGLHQNVGWMSEGRAKATDAVWLEVDLGKVQEFDALQLFPAKRPTDDLPSGFGFPRRFKVSVTDPEDRDKRFEKEVELANPGHNPVLVPLGRCRGRSVKIEITQLWKAFESFPAFVALSEVEVRDGQENRALGAAVRTAGGMGMVIGTGSQYWNAASLSDGFGPDGKLVATRTWLIGLDRRLGLEARLHQLQPEPEAILSHWRRMGLTVFAVLGGVGALLLIVLPIRYHMREKKELVRIRDCIASDLHDEVGSNLGSIQMFADLAQGHAGPSKELKRIQRIAAETVSAVRDIVWLLRPQGDHRIGTVEHLRETGSIMLESHVWEFTANEAAWQCEMSDEANRHLFLYYREALHNVLRHAGASNVKIHAESDARHFRLTVADDGCGIAPEKLERPATLRALRQRVEALGAEFQVDSGPGEGTKLDLRIPLHRKRELNVKAPK